MADQASTPREAMYCHACHHQFQRDGDGIECPACRSASTEIITSENDPRQFHGRQPLQPPPPTGSPAPPSPSPANNSGPADTRNGSDPSGGSTTDTHSEGPSPASDQNPASAASSAAGQNPHGPEIVFMFQPRATLTFFTPVEMIHPVTQRPQGEATPQSPGTEPQHPPVAHIGFNFFLPSLHVSQPAPPTTGDNAPAGGADSNSSADQHHDQQHGVADQPQARPQPQTANPHQAALMSFLVSSMFRGFPGIVFPTGDGVYSEEALDRIITQMREAQGQQPCGAPPASQAAIDRLEVRELDEKMLRGACHEGKKGDDAATTARCVICVDEMAVGEKASVLPCQHFFHGECVTPWLRQHNTCPICRRPVEEKGVKSDKGRHEHAGSEMDWEPTLHQSQGA